MNKRLLKKVLEEQLAARAEKVPGDMRVEY